MNNVFKKLRATTDSYSGDLCRTHHKGLWMEEWSHYLANRSKCALCRKIVSRFRDFFDELEQDDKKNVRMKVGRDVSWRIINGGKVDKEGRTREFEREESWTRNTFVLSVEMLYFHKGTRHFDPDEAPDNSYSRSLKYDDILFHNEVLEGNAAKFFRRPRLVQEQIDFNLIGEWLAHCDKEHGKGCALHPWEFSSNGVLSSVFRVIDVQDICLVQGPPSCRYLTLSYVWGQCTPPPLQRRDMARLSEKHGLRGYLEAMPRTIRDAISVTKQIGERYLWVDQVCIFQQEQDNDDKVSQLAIMDQIYQNSILTIVAASGDDAHSGLAGVKPGSRIRPDQEVVSTGEGLHFFTPLEVPTNISSLKWNGRGWCYQEKILSKRFLVFTKEQVFWRCRGVTWLEDMWCGNNGDKIDRDTDHYIIPLVNASEIADVFAPLRWNSNLFDQEAHAAGHDVEAFPDGSTVVVRSTGFETYATALQDYTARDLTNPGDRLRAFEGVLKVLTSRLRTNLLCGLPEAVFDIAILWQPVEPLVRNDKYKLVGPSWSWTGWSGGVVWTAPFTFNDTSKIAVPAGESAEERLRPLLTWYCGNTQQRAFENEQSTTVYEPVNGTGAGIRDAVRVDGTMPWPAFEWKVLHPSDLSTGPISPMYLRFWTSISTFRACNAGDGNLHILQKGYTAPMIAGGRTLTSIAGSLIPTTGNPGRELWQRKVDREEAMRTAQTFNDFDSYADPPEPSEPPFMEVTLILLSESGVSAETLRDTLHGEMREFNVMWVEESEVEGVYERVGLGRIGQYFWITADLQMKLITLG